MGWNKIRKIGGWWAKLLPTSSTCRVKTFVLFSAKPVPGQKRKKQKQRQKRMGTWRVRECTHSLGIVALSWNFCECESTQAPFHGYLGETIFVYSFEARHLHPLCKYVDKSQPLNLLFTKKRTSRHLKPVDFKDSRAVSIHTEDP